VNGEHQGFAAELIADFEAFRAFASSLELLNCWGPIYISEAS